MPPDRMPVVLCVDDEASIRSALRRVFLDEPWELHLAAGGDEGLAFLREHDADLVLSDFRMPGMDGVTFLKKAKEIRPDCIRLVLSGYADIKLIVSALNEGEVYRFLAKPWNDGELQHNVRKALEHHRLSHENARLNEELLRFNAALEAKVEERTRELTERNRALRAARNILEVLPMPVLGIDADRTVLLANAKAREVLACEELVGRAAPDLLDPELTGALQVACDDEQTGAEPRILPMVIDGVAVGAIILAGEDALLRVDPAAARDAFRWTVAPA